MGGRTLLDVDAGDGGGVAAASASTTVDARRRDEIAPPPGGTRCRDDGLSREKYANPIGPDPAPVLRPPLAKRFTEMSIFLFRVRALILERAAFPHAFPHTAGLDYTIPLINELIARSR